MERNLSFQFQYDDDDPTCPELLHVIPNPTMISDTELVLATTTCIQALATRHGLEQALTMVSDAVYGRLANGTQFDTRWLIN